MVAYLPSIHHPALLCAAVEALLTAKGSSSLKYTHTPEGPGQIFTLIGFYINIRACLHIKQPRERERRTGGERSEARDMVPYSTIDPT